jgi:hypothetical protein
MNGKTRNAYRLGYWWESQRERDDSEDKVVGGLILRWILERQDLGVLTGLVQLRIETTGGLL